MNYDPSCV